MAATTKSRTTTKKVVRKPKQKNVSDVELHAYVPDPAVAERYIGRLVHGVWDIVLADYAAENGHNMLLSGDTGAGKTMFSEAYASKHRLPYYSLPCDVSIDPSALFGRMQPPDAVGRFRWQDGPVTEIVRGPCGMGGDCDDPDCRAGVLNISEVNFMPPKIAASCFSLLDSRRYITLLAHEGEVVRAHKRLLITADLNPNYRGTVELNAAFLNRYAIKIPWGYEDEVEERLVHFPTVREFAKKLRAQYGTDLVTPVSTNMLMEFEKFVDALGTEFAIGNFTSAFRPDEQEPVKKVLDLNKDNVERDLKHFKYLNRRRRNKPVEDEEVEEVEFEFEEDNEE